MWCRNAGAISMEEDLEEGDGVANVFKEWIQGQVVAKG